MKAYKKQRLYHNDGYYFPLFNERGLKSSITPFFRGDLKTDHDHYALKPVTEVDLFDGYGRNVIFEVDGVPYFLNGQTKRQQDDELIYETRLLDQRVIRKNGHFTIDTTSFVPRDANVEVHRITFENNQKESLRLRVTTAIPLYARSADQLRDHRHVTSLLQRIEVVHEGILVQPTLSFNERGHEPNDTIYSVFAKSEAMTANRYIPVRDDFISGGSLINPKGLDHVMRDTHIAGYEAMGAIGFETVTIDPDEKIDLFISIGIHEKRERALDEGTRYLKAQAFEKARTDVQKHFECDHSKLSFNISDQETGDQLDWVVLDRKSVV